MPGRGKGAFRIAIEDFLDTFDFGQVIFGWYKTILEKFEIAGVEIYRKLADRLYPGLELPAAFRPDSFGEVVLSSQNGFFVWIAGIVGLLMGGLLGMGQPSGRIAAYFMDKQIRSFRSDPSTVSALIQRNILDEDTGENILNALGVPDDLKKPLSQLVEYIPSPPELEMLRRRGFLDDATYQREMELQGVTPQRMAEIKELREVIPSPVDLVSMAVREAFDPDIVRKFGYDENFPPALAEWGKKQGLSEEWSRRYWAAHWNLPAPNQVFEMLHRLRPGVSDVVVDDNTMDEYLRIADIAPFWRDRLKAISYNPFTRVDVRRMFKFGILNEGQVHESYLDLGYDDEKAQAMTEFTIAYATEEETGVVRSSVIRAYSSGMIDRATAENMLSGGGYDTTSIAFYLDTIDFDQALDINELKLKNIKKRYINGVIDETTVNGEINALNLPSERVTVMLELWNTERESKTTLPTASQTEKFYEMDIISVDDFKKIYTLRGYTTETIDWTLARIDIEAQAATQKEAERALADLEKIDKSKTAKQYQKDRAVLDLLIAQARAEITDIRVEIKADIDLDVQELLIARLDELKQFIAAVNTQKATLRVDLRTELIQ